MNRQESYEYSHDPPPQASQEFSSPVGEYAEMYQQSRSGQQAPQSQHMPPPHQESQHSVGPPNHPPPHRPPTQRPHLAYIPHSQQQQYASTDYQQISGPHPNSFARSSQVTASPASYNAPMSHEGYSYQSMNSAGPSTPATVHSQFTGGPGSSSSHDSGPSSPVTPNSIHSSLSHTSQTAAMSGVSSRGRPSYPRSHPHHRTHSASSYGSNTSQAQSQVAQQNQHAGQTQYGNGGSLVHRQPLRSHSHSSSTDGSVSGGSVRRHRRSDATNDSDDLDAELLGVVNDSLEQRREDARRQRQNAEQRRRDQLRDGYDRLQSALPAAKEKMSKVRLIECATQYIKDMTASQSELEDRIMRLEQERDTLRRQNEEVSHQLSGVSPPPLPQPSSSLNLNIPPPPPSSLPSAHGTAPSGLTVAPSSNLPVPLSGTAPPGQQRHASGHALLPAQYSHHVSIQQQYTNNGGTSQQQLPPHVNGVGRSDARDDAQISDMHGGHVEQHPPIETIQHAHESGEESASSNGQQQNSGSSTGQVEDQHGSISGGVQSSYNDSNIRNNGSFYG